MAGTFWPATYWAPRYFEPRYFGGTGGSLSIGEMVATLAGTGGLSGTLRIRPPNDITIIVRASPRTFKGGRYDSGKGRS